MKGALLKQRDHVKTWRPRFFILHREDGLLLYYLPNADPRLCPPRGALPVAGCTLRQVDDVHLPKGHVFAILHPWMRPWFLAAPTPAERDAWMQSIGELLAQSSSQFGAVMESSRLSLPSTVAPPTAQAVDRDSHSVPEFGARIEEALRTMLELATSEEGWQLNFEKRGVRAFKRSGTFTTLRGTGVIQHHPIAILLAIFDSQIAPKLDAQLNYAKRIRVLNHHNFSDYLLYKGVWPVAPRDMYIQAHWRVHSDGTLLVVISSEPDGLHPAEPGVVRADCKSAGWVIKPLDAAGSSCHCTYFSMVDLCGDIPKVIVDKATEGQPLLIAEIQQHLTKHGRSADFHVDVDGLKSGFSEKDVYPYIRRLHRRQFGAWKEQAPWLAEHHHSPTSVTATALGSSPPAAVQDEDQQQGPKPASSTAGATMFDWLKLAPLVLLLIFLLWANSHPGMPLNWSRMGTALWG